MSVQVAATNDSGMAAVMKRMHSKAESRKKKQAALYTDGWEDEEEDDEEDPPQKSSSVKQRAGWNEV